MGTVVGCTCPRQPVAEDQSSRPNPRPLFASSSYFLFLRAFPPRLIPRGGVSHPPLVIGPRTLHLFASLLISHVTTSHAPSVRRSEKKKRKRGPSHPGPHPVAASETLLAPWRGSNRDGSQGWLQSWWRSTMQPWWVDEALPCTLFAPTLTDTAAPSLYKSPWPASDAHAVGSSVMVH